MHRLSWEPICEPNFQVFLNYEWHRGPRVKLVGCRSAFNPKVVYTTDRPKAVVPVLLLLCVALWLILRGDLYQVLPCVLSLCFWALLAQRSSHLGKESWFVCFSCACLFCSWRFVFYFFSSSSWCQGLAATCDCGTLWTFLFIFYKELLCQIRSQEGIPTSPRCLILN